MAKVEKRTYNDRRQYMMNAVKKYRKKIRLKAVEYKGGKCEMCGYDRCIEALEFHHKNPLEKDFSISTDGCTRSWERVRKELEKCVMLCANCHRELHAELAAHTGNHVVNSGLNQGNRNAHDTVAPAILS